MTATAPISVRQVLCLFLQAYQYPHLGNEDERESRRLEEEARTRAIHAVPSPDDPPEFQAWLKVLINPTTQATEREAVYFAMLDDGPVFGLPVQSR